MALTLAVIGMTRMGMRAVGTLVSLEGSTRGESLIPQEGGLIMEMEREATEVGVGGWFNRMVQGELES